MGLTMFLVDSEAAGEERIAKIPVFESSAPETEVAVEEAAGVSVGKKTTRFWLRGRGGQVEGKDGLGSAACKS